MLVFDFRTIGNKLFLARKRTGLTQAAVAEKADISDRTYADIERGNVNMRINTFLRICDALGTTPDEILTQEENDINYEEIIWNRLRNCSKKEKETVLKLIAVYLHASE